MSSSKMSGGNTSTTGPSGRAVCGSSPTEIAGSNPTGGMDDRLF